MLKKIWVRGIVMKILVKWTWGIVMMNPWIILWCITAWNWISAGLSWRLHGRARNSTYQIILFLKLFISQEFSELEIAFEGKETVTSGLVHWTLINTLRQSKSTPILAAIALSPSRRKSYSSFVISFKSYILGKYIFRDL